MKEVTLFVDEHDILHALLPNGEQRALLVDTYDSSCYGIVKLGEQPDCVPFEEKDDKKSCITCKHADIVTKRSKKVRRLFTVTNKCKLIEDCDLYSKWEKKEE